MSQFVEVFLAGGDTLALQGAPPAGSTPEF